MLRRVSCSSNSKFVHVLLSITEHDPGSQYKSRVSYRGDKAIGEAWGLPAGSKKRRQHMIKKNTHTYYQVSPHPPAMFAAGARSAKAPKTHPSEAYMTNNKTSKTTRPSEVYTSKYIYKKTPKTRPSEKHIHIPGTVYVPIPTQKKKKRSVVGEEVCE